MTYWTVVRCKPRREAFTAQQIIAKLHVDAWAPEEAISCRVHRRHKARLVSFRPAMPGRLFAALPVGADGDLAEIDGAIAICRNFASLPLLAPEIEIRYFREAIDQYNAEVVALARICRGGKRRKWLSLKDGLESLMKGDAVDQTEAA